VSSLAGVPVLVTGGAGFIGSHLVDALVAAGARVRVFDDLSSGRRDNLQAVSDRCELLVGDLRDLEACRIACRGARLVFHQAALGSVPRSIERPAETIAVNVTGTANLFAAARDAQVERVVYASSSSVYGDRPGLPKREGEEGSPLSPYALSKKLGEEVGAHFQQRLGLSTIGLRYFNVYGPRQDPAGPYAAVVPRFFRALLGDGEPVVYGDGTQSRDFTYVADAVAANLAAAVAPLQACGRAYNVAAGVQTSLLDLLAVLARLLGRVVEPRRLPRREGDVEHSLADVSQAAAQLGFRAQVDLETGLRHSLDHYAAAVSP
jgi:nucleoside-diphosphate-sugar epimerase